MDKAAEQLYELGVKQGREQGLEQGLEQGIKQGIEQGEINKSKKLAIKIYKDHPDLAYIADILEATIPQVKEWVGLAEA